MVEAPERIWAFRVRASGLEFGEWVEDPSDTASGTEYVRADLSGSNKPTEEQEGSGGQNVSTD